MADQSRPAVNEPGIVNCRWGLGEGQWSCGDGQTWLSALGLGWKDSNGSGTFTAAESVVNAKLHLQTDKPSLTSLMPHRHKTSQPSMQDNLPLTRQLLLKQQQPAQ